jgi:predicted ATPase/DNA-binding SARP family transcriptional activator
MGPSMVEPLTLHLFGPFEATVQGVPLPRLVSRKSQHLLALLTLRAGRRVERTWLAATLWTDSPESQALRSLRTSLWDLRRALGPEAVRLHSPTADTLLLELSGAHADVIAFDAAIGHGDIASLASAVALHRGPLLEGWVEEWLLPERQAREQACLTALERLAADALPREDAAMAERYLRQAVAIDPLRESAQRALMQTLAEGGSDAAALLVYRELRLRLHRELNAAPDPETTALFQALRARARRASPGGGAETGKGALSRRPGPDAPGGEPRSEGAEARHNLTLPPTALIGREPELPAVRELLLRQEVRLLTLAGPPGTGKTRLGLQVAADLFPSFADGVRFVSLAPISDPGLVVSTIAHTVGVQESGNRPLLQGLNDALREQHLLLVLDNFEQVLDASPQISELVAAAPRLKVLVTSREALRVRGEQEFPVPPLAVPDLNRLPPAAALTQYAAVELFVQRAVAVKPNFRVTDDNTRAVAEICCRLDGLPLALELAAVRVKLFSPDALLGRLENRLKLLTGGARDLPVRQQTLRDAIAWSYDLLDEPEQRLFRRLSVFVGGCSLETAEAVCDATGDLEVDFLEGVASLVDKNLLHQGEALDGQPRFGMLETIREYAREQLARSGEAAAVLRQHASYFAGWAEADRESVAPGRQKERLDRLEREHDNLRAAVDWAVDSEDGELGLRLGAALGKFWILRGHLNEARYRLRTLLEVPGASERTAIRAQVLNDTGGVTSYQGDLEAARPFWEECLAIGRECGDERRIAGTLVNLGNLARPKNSQAAQALHEEALEIFRKIGYQPGEFISLNLLAWDIEAQGDTERARTLWEQALSMRGVVDDVGIDVILRRLGLLAMRQGDYQGARALYAESLTNCRDLGNKLGMPGSLQMFGRLAVVQAQPVRAARLSGAAAALQNAMGMPHDPIYAAEIAPARDMLGEEAFTAAWAEGRAMTLSEAIAYALDETRAD